MSVRWRKDSVAELRKKKSVEELQKENEALKKQLAAQAQQIDDTMLALCEVYELLVPGDGGDA